MPRSKALKISLQKKILSYHFFITTSLSQLYTRACSHHYKKFNLRIVTFRFIRLTSHEVKGFVTLSCRSMIARVLWLLGDRKGIGEPSPIMIKRGARCLLFYSAAGFHLVTYWIKNVSPLEQVEKLQLWNSTSSFSFIERGCLFFDVHTYG